MADKKGDTEMRVDALVMEIFRNFNKPFDINDMESNDDLPILSKEEIKEYIHEMMR